MIWRHGHVAEAAELSPSDACSYWSDVVTVSNWVPHLHTHVLPRFANDPAPGGPIEWAEIFADEPTSPTELHRIVERLATRLSSAGGSDDLRRHR